MQAGSGAAGVSPCIDSYLLSLPVRDPPPSPAGPLLSALSDLCGAGAGPGGPAGPEGETAQTPGTGSGREGLFPLAEQGCGKSWSYPLLDCLSAVSPGRLGRAESPSFPASAPTKNDAPGPQD